MPEDLEVERKLWFEDEVLVDVVKELLSLADAARPVPGDALKIPDTSVLLQAVIAIF